MIKRPRLRRALAILLPVVLVGALPAFGLLGSLSGVASELTQILNVAENALSAVETAATAAETAKTVLELEDQIEQDLDAAMGRIGALQQRFDALSSDPASLLENAQGVAWAGDFTGEPLQLLNALADMQDDTGNSLTTHWRQSLAAADTVDRNRYRRAYRSIPTASDNWVDRRERAEQRLVGDLLVLDSAERVAELLGNASQSIGRSRQQTELSETALAQEQRANQLTDIEVDIAVAQLTAHHAARNMLDQLALEQEHREWLEASVTAEGAESRGAAQAQARVGAQGNAWSRAFALN